MKRRYLASILGALALLLAAGTATATAAAPGVQSGRPERRQRATGDLRLRSDANRSEQHEHLRSRAQPRRRRGGHAVQHGVVECDLVELQLDDAERESGSGRGGIQTSTQDAGNAQVADALSGVYQSGCEQHEPSGSRAEPGLERRRDPVERRGLDRGLDQHQHDGPDVGSGPVRRILRLCRGAVLVPWRPDLRRVCGCRGAAVVPWRPAPRVPAVPRRRRRPWRPVRRPVGRERAARGSRLLGHAGRPVQHEHLGPRAQPRERRGSRPVEHGEVEGRRDEHERHDADVRSGPVGRRLRMHARSDPGRQAVQREPPGCACTLGRGPAGRRRTIPRLSASAAAARTEKSTSRTRSTSKADASNKNSTTQTADQDSGAHVRWMRVRWRPGHPGRWVRRPRTGRPRWPAPRRSRTSGRSRSAAAARAATPTTRSASGARAVTAPSTSRTRRPRRPTRRTRTARRRPPTRTPAPRPVDAGAVAAWASRSWVRRPRTGRPRWPAPRRSRTSGRSRSAAAARAATPTTRSASGARA